MHSWLISLGANLLLRSIERKILKAYYYIFEENRKYSAANGCKY